MQGPHRASADSGIEPDRSTTGVASASPRCPSRAGLVGRLGGIAGLALLIVWGGWWIDSVRENRLEHADGLWLPALDVIAGDFLVHIRRAGRIWAGGGSPYEPMAPYLICPPAPMLPRCQVLSIAALVVHDHLHAFPYPPLVPRFFSWTA